jgi:hypothetical protein
MHRRGMAKIIRFKFRRTRLPRRLLNAGWWLEQAPVRRSVVAFQSVISEGNDDCLRSYRNWRSSGFRAWRLERYLGNNPDASSNPKKSDKG